MLTVEPTDDVELPCRTSYMSSRDSLLSVPCHVSTFMFKVPLSVVVSALDFWLLLTEEVLEVFLSWVFAVSTYTITITITHTWHQHSLMRNLNVWKHISGMFLASSAHHCGITPVAYVQAPLES
ncbi:hypothetical protein EDC04DRAFT_1885511 [Pisolithus marmoratus]|nr:hypothetical protein EDC04DRAFT_1885511 [Pisolithus marmoratus]